MYYNLLPVNPEDSVEKYVADYVEMPKVVQQIVPNVNVDATVADIGRSQNGRLHCDEQREERDEGVEQGEVRRA